MRELSTTQLIVLGFLSAILVGTVLLCLPFSSAQGQWTPFLDALFTATTSVCVTGLVVADTYAYWSLFGQIVILLLVQCGGLGIITLTTGVLLMIGKKVTLKNRLLLEDAFNLNTLSGLIRFLKKVVKGTFLVEGMGAVCYMFVFVPKYGVRGIWISLFNGVSAFCNAGMDLIGGVSLSEYVGNVPVNLITMGLIIVSGIGFIVWWDLGRIIQLLRRREIKTRQCWNRLTLHSKLVLVTTGMLLLVGAAVVLAVEYYNPETLGPLSFGEKLMASFFQSVTCRTAGFFTVSQAGLKDATALFCMILMFIGGSPVGTAGGIKTTTAALLVIAALSQIKGHGTARAFGRTISVQNIRKALAVTLISMAAVIAALMLLLCVQEGSFVDIAYEVFSAVGTVGLTRNLTSGLGTAGKIIIIVCMYLGRIGPISMAIAFGHKKGTKGSVTYPLEEVTVG